MRSEGLSSQEPAKLESRRVLSLRAAEDLAALAPEINTIDRSRRTSAFKDVAYILRTEGIPVRPIFEGVDGLYDAEWMVDAPVDEFVGPPIERLRKRDGKLHSHLVSLAAHTRRRHGLDISPEISWLTQNIPLEEPDEMSVEISSRYAHLAELLDMNGDDSGAALQKAEDLLFVGVNRGAYRNRCMVLMDTHIKAGRLDEAERILQRFDQHLGQIGYIEEIPIHPRVIAFNKLRRSKSQADSKADDKSVPTTITLDWRDAVYELDQYRFRQEAEILARERRRKMSPDEKIAELEKSVQSGTDDPYMAGKLTSLASLQRKAELPQWQATLNKAHEAVTRSFDNEDHVIEHYNDVFHNGLDYILEIANEYARAHDFDRAKEIIAQMKELPYTFIDHWTEAMAVLAAEEAKCGLSPEEIAGLPDNHESMLIRKFIIDTSVV